MPSWGTRACCPDRGGCAAVPFAAGDYPWGRRVERLLNRLAAARRRSARARPFVDLYPASRGHDACAGSRAWLNGSQTLFGLAAGFHPFQEGMRGMARAVHAFITGDPAPRNADAEPPPGSVVRNGPPETGQPEAGQPDTRNWSTSLGTAVAATATASGSGTSSAVTDWLPPAVVALRVVRRLGAGTRTSGSSIR